MINPVLEKFALPSESDNRFSATPGLIFFAMSLGHCPKQRQAFHRQ